MSGPPPSGPSLQESREAVKNKKSRREGLHNDTRQKSGPALPQVTKTKVAPPSQGLATPHPATPTRRPFTGQQRTLFRLRTPPPQRAQVTRPEADPRQPRKRKSGGAVVAAPSWGGRRRWGVWKEEHAHKGLRPVAADREWSVPAVGDGMVCTLACGTASIS